MSTRGRTARSRAGFQEATPWRRGLAIPEAIRELPAPMACLAHGRRLLPFALLVGLAVPARAQLPPLTVPKGQIRLDFSGGLADWSERYRDGRKEAAAGDFLRNPVDAGWLPELAALETSLGRILGTSPSGLSLGRTRSQLLVNTGTAGIGLAFGLTSRLTIFGTVPFVRVKVQNTFDLDSAGSTLGLNPAHPVFGTVDGQVQAGTLLAELDLVLAELQTRIQAGFYDADPPTKAVAEATLLRGADIRAELGGLLTGGTTVFLPTLTSATGTALTTTIEDLRTTFTTTLSPLEKLEDGDVLYLVGDESDVMLARARLTEGT